jgi:hypothetical protein
MGTIDKINTVDVRIKPGDYFIARKPEYVTQTPVWDVYMCRYDGVIQKCEEIRNSYIRSDNDTPLYHPSWCEKVSVGDVMKTEYDDLFIFKGVSDGDYLDFAYYKGGKPPKLFIDDTPNSMVAVSHATKGEEQVLFNALARAGKKWNKEKLQVEDIKWVPKAGEFVAHKDGWIHIHKRIEEDGRVKHYAAMSPGGDVYYNDFVGFESDLRGPATESEKKKLIEAIGKEGKQWNEEKMCVEDIPKPKTDEECLRAWGCGEKAIDDYMKYSKKYDMVSKLYAENSFRQLPFIDVLYESYMLDKRKSLKQIIKLCKQLLNE